jgi:hypothetical protein
MTAPALPRGGCGPRTAPGPADPTLRALRDECDALRRQLVDLQQHAEKLAVRLQQYEEAGTPPAVAPNQPVASTAPPDGPPLRDLIDALLRGGEAPEHDAVPSPRPVPPARPLPLLRRLGRRDRRRLAWVVAAAALLAVAGVLCRLVF